jgi:hypothetical protein
LSADCRITEILLASSLTLVRAVKLSKPNSRRDDMVLEGGGRAVSTEEHAARVSA